MKDSQTETIMKVREAMSRDVRTVAPTETIRDAAKTMAAIDAGAIPVAANDRLVGMITDRDIVVRGIAEGLGPDTQVREVMTDEIRYCFDDEDLDDVASNMGDLQVRRLPVVSRDKRLVGIVSLGDVAMLEGRGAAGKAIKGISRPGGAHSQTASS
jgi:CBS domain-containing protein